MFNKHDNTWTIDLESLLVLRETPKLMEHSVIAR